MLAQGVPRARHALIWLRQDRDAGLIGFQNGKSIVGAAVIEDKDFIWLNRLAKD
jgi:hypothetical protein